jgi:hypothetical protein
MNCVNFSVGGMLMNADDLSINHLDIAVVDLGDGVHEPVPIAGLAPAVEAIVTGRVGTIALRQVTPPCAPRLVWKKRLDDRPFEIREVIAATYDQAPTVWKLESQDGRFVNPIYGDMA